MSDNLLSAKEAAKRLGISRATIYHWLAESNAGVLMIRGQSVTIDYFQSGPQGEGRIKIVAAEVDRLLSLMRVSSRSVPRSAASRRRTSYPGITVTLGRPD